MPATPKSHRRSDSPSPPFGIRAVFQDLDGAEEAAEPDLVALCVRVRQPLAVRQAVGLLCWLAGLSRDQLWGRQNATERGEGSAVGAAWWLTALLHNGHGDYGEALAAARQAVEFEDVNFYGWALVELIEASVRSGRLDEAASALDRLSERTRASGTEWALGIEARC